jgi:hypothetical protein
LDTEFTGKVKFIKIMQEFQRNHAGNEVFQKLIEPFSRWRPHRVEVPVDIRGLLTALFNRTHTKQLKKIIAWSKPSKLLTQEQQQELLALFHQYDARNEGRFPVRILRQHLLDRGLPAAEVERMLAEIEVEYPSQTAAASAAAQSQPHSQGTSVAGDSHHPLHGSDASPRQTSTLHVPGAGHVRSSSSGSHSHLESKSQTLHHSHGAAAPHTFHSQAHDAALAVAGAQQVPHAADEPMITLQEFQIFYRDMWSEQSRNMQNRAEIHAVYRLHLFASCFCLGFFFSILGLVFVDSGIPT